MKCVYCGFESETNFIFCPNCGKEVPVDVYGDENPAASHILSVLKDKLFFVLCILLTVGSAASVLAGGMNLLAVLATIFIWLVYNSGTKNIVDAKNLRSLSGTTYAYYIIMNVTAVIVGICALITALCIPVLSASELFSELVEELSDVFGNYVFILSASSILIVIVLLVVAGLILVLNLLGLKNIHKFIKSVYQSVETKIISYEKCKSAETWLMVFGIIGAVSSLSSLGDLPTFVSSASIAASEIIASLLIKKHFNYYK